MFYVNSSKGDILDPKPSKSSLEATTLVGLLQKISLKFKKGDKRLSCKCPVYSLICCILQILKCSKIIFFSVAFREFLDKKASAHPFENAQCPFRPNQWLGLHPVPGELYPN